MQTWVTPVDKLGAVNVALAGLGQTKVNSLNDGDLGADAYLAIQFVEEAQNDLESEGWYFNEEYHSLAPNTQGEIFIPSNTLDIKPTQDDQFVVRGQRLFNLNKNSWTFKHSVDVRIIVALPFEHLPNAARNFISALAAVRLQQQALGADHLDKTLKERASQSRNILQRDDIRARRKNMLSDSYSVSKIINRRGGVI